MKKQYLAMALGVLLTLGYQGGAQAAEVMDDKGQPQQVKVVDLEHHFDTEILMDYAQKDSGLDYNDLSPEMLAQHELEQRLDEVKIAELDKAGIDFAQISLTTPATEIFDVEKGKLIATDANNRAAEAIRKYPNRIGAYMTLVPGDVEWSLKEIDRCLAMGLWGWSTMSNYKDGDRLDNPKYEPLLARCNELKMPIFLHPYFPTGSKEIMEAGYTLFGPNFGFTEDTQLAFFRLLFRGTFDRYPDLKIILGHNAEGLAIYEDRVNTAHRQGMGQPYPEFGHIDHEPSYYLHHNLIGDTSGSFRRDVLHFTIGVFGDRFLVLGTDYPYEDTKASVELVSKDDRLTFAQKKAILQDNAAAVGIGFSHLK